MRGEIAKATSTARNYTVWFGRYKDSDYGNGPVQWRVLSGGGSADPDDGANLPVSGTGEALLISKDLLDTDCNFKEDDSSNQWAGSDAQAWCTAFWSSSKWLTAVEKSAVNATTVNEQNDKNDAGRQYFYRGGYFHEYYSAAPLKGEHTSSCRRGKRTSCLPVIQTVRHSMCRPTNPECGGCGRPLRTRVATPGA